MRLGSALSTSPLCDILIGTHLQTLTQNADLAHSATGCRCRLPGGQRGLIVGIFATHGMLVGATWSQCSAFLRYYEYDRPHLSHSHLSSPQIRAVHISHSCVVS